MIDQKYLELFAYSVQLKDWGLLNSSLKKRQEASAIVHGNPGMHAIGKANEAILLGHHIGDGPAAYSAAKESLKNIDAFAAADKEWVSACGFSLIKDMLGFIVQWSEGYDEGLDYSGKAKQYAPQVFDERVLVQLRGARQGGRQWWETQFAFSQNFYSRVSQQADAGKYAAGKAILECIIIRALAEKPGYEMDAEDIFNLLDDCVVLALQTYFGIVPKFTEQLRQGNATVANANGPEEQFIVFENPLKLWKQLMPECPAKWKGAFAEHYRAIKSSPFPICPDIMAEIGVYF